MRAYLYSPSFGLEPTMLADLAAVKAKLRTVPKDCRDDVRITLQDFANDKASFISACNGNPPPARAVLKKWRIGGPRGGRLIEIPVTEE